jgi:predicted nucleic acid-binding protein
VLLVADTGPPHYLVLIGAIEVLPNLFGRVMLPETVRDELEHSRTPEIVRRWVADPPAWVEFAATPPLGNLLLPEIDAGERTAIVLAVSRRADLVLMDDRLGVAAALAAGLRAIGTIGVLDRAARRGLIDLPASVTRLRSTNFRCRPEMLDALLADHDAKET